MRERLNNGPESVLFGSWGMVQKDILVIKKCTEILRNEKREGEKSGRKRKQKKYLDSV